MGEGIIDNGRDGAGSVRRQGTESEIGWAKTDCNITNILNIYVFEFHIPKNTIETYATGGNTDSLIVDNETRSNGYCIEKLLSSERTCSLIKKKLMNRLPK